jgi:hypothetical protein
MKRMSMLVWLFVVYLTIIINPSLFQVVHAVVVVVVGGGGAAAADVTTKHHDNVRHYHTSRRRNHIMRRNQPHTNLLLNDRVTNQYCHYRRTIRHCCYDAFHHRRGTTTHSKSSKQQQHYRRMNGMIHNPSIPSSSSWLDRKQQSWIMSQHHRYNEQRKWQLSLSSLSSSSTSLLEQLIKQQPQQQVPTDYLALHIDHLMNHHILSPSSSSLFLSLVSSLDASDPSSVIQFSSLSIWCIRFMTIFICYISVVLYYDRPRGMLQVNLNDDIIVQPSKYIPNGGFGLYANKHLKQGTILGTYPGVINPIQHHISKLYQYPYCETYIWKFSDNHAGMFSNNENCVCVIHSLTVFCFLFCLPCFFSSLSCLMSMITIMFFFTK